MSDRVKKARENAHMSQRTAADRMHYDKQTIYRYEYDNPSPAWPIVKMLALIYGTSVDYLTGKSDDPSPDEMLVPVNEQKKYDALFQQLSEEDRDLVISLMERLVKKKLT